MEPSSNAFSAALEQALARLKTRERFSGEMRAWLSSRGFDDAVTEEVLSHLIRRRLLDDGRAADALVKRKSGKRSVGSELLRTELSLNGADPALIETVLEDRGGLDAALAALSSKRSWKRREQAGRFLMSRGFAEEIVESALEAAFGQQQQTD